MKRVKVALDANIPPRSVRMLQAGFGDQGFEFLHETQFAAGSADDDFWASAFKRFGGEVAISADKNIAKRPHQIIAFKENNLKCFFFEARWSEQDSTFKIGHLMFWWPRIQIHLAQCNPKDCWWVPMTLSAKVFREVRLPDHVLKTAKERHTSR